MRVTIAQLNPVIGDIEGNLGRISDTLSRCSQASPDLVVFPECFIIGYPPRDLLERTWFIERTQRAIIELVKMSRDYPGIGIVFGAPIPSGRQEGRALYNAALLVCQGQVLMRQGKSLLPTYDVFDETRYFEPAAEIQAVPFKDQVLGISVCEDAWNDPELWTRRIYARDPVEELARNGATLFINISASPFSSGKEEIRYRIIRSHARKYGIPFVLVNQVGGNDELIFDGRSMFVDGQGEPAMVFPAFKEHIETIESTARGTAGGYRPQDPIESVYEALLLGIRDYMAKCGLAKAVIGLSGGIDSALTCSLACAAIGRENVLGIAMPGPFSSVESVEDARDLAGNLGIDFKVISIHSMYEAYREALKGHSLVDKQVDVTLENIQARIRGNVLMAFSNRLGSLVLSTGNKSELAVGYCTLYGDMAGGLAAISDVPKTMVYDLAHYVNRDREIIPARTLEKPPSAELRPDQKDQDTLPPYDMLDRILYYYVDEGRSMQDILEKGLDPDTVQWVIRAVNRNEYKRRQAAPGLKVTTKAFGVGRRIPVAAKY